MCPACRTVEGGRVDVRTLARDDAGDDRADSALACACGRRYPIIDHIPIVFASPQHGGPDAASIVERDLPPDVAALIAAPGPDDAPYARLLEHLSVYLDAHWGERGFASPDLLGKLAALERVPLAVELGCSAGRCLAELARTADHVVGLDLQPAMLRRARRILSNEPLAYARRMAGRHYEAAALPGAGALALAPDRYTLVAGDALDPPLVPGAYDRVAAFNVLDAVRRPGDLLTVMDALCAPGGELILTSPYSWQTGIVDEDARLGGADPAAAVRALLASGLSAPYHIQDDADLAWTLRRDARSAATYCIHYIRARKG